MFKQFILALITILTLDALWLGVVASSFYNSALGPIARRIGDSLSPNWLAVAGSYLLIIFGLLYFVVPRFGASLTSAFIAGAVFGLVAYGIYDFTNMATLSQWSWKLVLVDMLWGALLCGVTSAILFHFAL